MWLGYKDSLTLDMLSELDPKMSAKNTLQRFSAGWKRGMNILAYFTELEEANVSI